jgi:hypothetical protein
VAQKSETAAGCPNAIRVGETRLGPAWPNIRFDVQKVLEEEKGRKKTQQEQQKKTAKISNGSRKDEKKEDK